MNTALSVCKLQVQPLVNFQGELSREPPFFHHQYRKDKVVIILGATGSGKSRLAIDLSDRCFLPGEVVNSDKMQIYKGLDIATNKITEEERNKVPHHLLSIAEPNSNFNADDFCYQASSTVDSIVKKDRLPIIAGGSNSYVKSLVNDYPSFRLRYELCFLWIDVSLPVLHSFVSDRVDRMVEAGLVDEVREIFDPSADYSRGIRKAIGVPELDRFLRTEAVADERTKRRFLEAAIAEIKLNTCKLACRQLQKIHRLHGMGEWNMHRLDATEVFLKSGKEEAEEAWEELVMAKAKRIVKKFLDGKRPVFDAEERVAATIVPSKAPLIAVPPPPMTMAAVAAATH